MEWNSNIYCDLAVVTVMRKKEKKKKKRKKKRKVGEGFRYGGGGLG